MSTKNAFSPQAYVLYRAINDATLYTGQHKKKVMTKSGIGSKSSIQTTVPLARAGGNYHPEAALNAMMSQKDPYTIDEHFLNIENYKLSAMVPELLFYKQEKKKYVPFYFPVTTNYEFTDPNVGNNINLEKPFSANSPVIKSFDLKFMGVNPFEAGRGSIQATLQIEVDSLSVIFDAPKGFAPLADLFVMKNTKQNRTVRNNLGRATSRSRINKSKQLPIGAMIGYSLPNNTEIFSTEEKRAIEKTKLFATMYYAGHTLSIAGAQGQATITIEYHGHLHATKHDMVYNLFEKPATKAKRFKALTVPGHKAPKDMSATKSRQPQITVSSKNDYFQKIIMPFSRIIEILYEKKKIHSTIVNDQDKFHSFNESATNAQNPAQTASPAGSGAKSSLNPYALFSSHYVHYVTVGDFLDAYFYVVNENLSYVMTLIAVDLKDKKITQAVHDEILTEITEDRAYLSGLQVLFGKVSFRRKGKVTTEEHEISIADIPIALETITSDLYKEYTRPKKSFFGIQDCLERFMLRIIANSFGEIPNSDMIFQVDVELHAFTGPKLKDKIENGEIDITEIKGKPINSTQPSKNSKYVFYHQIPAVASRTISTGAKKADTGMGIFHLRPSQDRGLVKSFSFSQMQVPYRTEHATVGEGMIYDELRIPQNATVSMYGNTLFIPNTLVYIDPNYLGFGDPRDLNSASRRLGIGGYYTVITSNLSYTQGTLNTSLNLSWWGWPESNSQPKLTKKQITASKKVGDLMKNAARLGGGPP